MMRAGLVMVAVMAGTMMLQPVVADDKDESAYLRSVTVMNLDAEARRVVTQDRVQVTLMIQRDGKTAMEAQSKVNDKMREALGLAKAANGVKASTGYYNSYKQYPPEQPIPTMTPDQREKKAYWTAQQTLVLDGGDKDTVLKLAGAIQSLDFAMQGMNFYLSREAGDKIKDELLAEALATVKTRAQKVASQMGTPNVRFARINLGGGAPVYPVMMMARGAMMDKAEAGGMPAPEGAAGESEVTLTVNVEVHLGR